MRVLLFLNLVKLYSIFYKCLIEMIRHFRRINKPSYKHEIY